MRVLSHCSSERAGSVGGKRTRPLAARRRRTQGCCELAACRRGGCSPGRHRLGSARQVGATELRQTLLRRISLPVCFCTLGPWFCFLLPGLLFSGPSHGTLGFQLKCRSPERPSSSTFSGSHLAPALQLVTLSQLTCLVLHGIYQYMKLPFKLGVYFLWSVTNKMNPEQG